MAFRKLVCSQCGEEVAPHDAYCGSCGVKLDAAPAAAAGTVGCAVCGHVNSAAASYCESCGARLGATSRKKPASRTAPSKADRRRFKPWQIVSLVAVVAILVYVAATQLATPSAPPSGPASGVSAGAPMPLPDFTRYERAIAVNPKDTTALIDYANALFDAGAFPRAATMYERYLELNPSNPNARVDLGICKFELAKIDSANRAPLFAAAISEMQRALKSAPTHQPAAFNLGVVHLTMGNVKESVRWFKRAVELNPSSDLGLRAKRILDQHSSITP